MNTCGNCANGAFIMQDVTKRTCRGGPPQLVVVPSPKGPAIQTMFPNVEASQPACGAWKDKLQLVDNPAPITA
jgi:hypothetical protein